ncbi:DUF4272 domain-containing protein [Pontibacter sp. HSC-36F09]|uniref:DUF4272 domain-containing protein n=1 Tax=Pontibacter sp. HSC-36F09 TaxID=2910966 RepID=UPI0020A18D77|nr:DUF4272 domain-containing protein [Pontibacter sp. HSC-36F09]MCP2045812.1 hypothetical protein [Pontibacter sp. HSC-36F09]
MWFNQKIKPEDVKLKNTKFLRSNGIDVIEHLPYLDTPNFRDPEQIAKRMMVQLAIFQLHLEAPNRIIKKWIEDNELSDFLTSGEMKYLQSDYQDLPEQDQIDIYWYVEAIWTFAWIGGLHNKLTFNTGVEDSLASMTPKIEKNEPAESFIKKFKLRSRLEIFEMLDKFYRAHWFARNNDLTGKESDKVDLDIIMERREALEYTCYNEYEWDSISLDT